MKRKINLDRKEISSEEIAKGKDFKSVLQKLKAVPAVVPKPYYKKWGFLAGSIAVVAIVATLIIANPFAETRDVTSGWDYNTPVEHGGFTKVSDSDFTYNPNKSFISPPFDFLDPKFEVYKIKGEKGGEIVTKEGSKIKVQGNALLGEDGKPVKGDVDVKVREFHDPVDLFLSGIPMGYDSAGIHYDFETAGMIEVYAFQGGKVLKIDPNKKVTIELKTNSGDSKFNVYELDTVGKNWEFRGKDLVKKSGAENRDLLAEIKQDTGVKNIATLENPINRGFTFNGKDTAWFVSGSTQTNPKIDGNQQKADVVLGEIKQIQQEIVKLEETAPLKPKTTTKGLYNFNIDVNKGEFPEIAVYKDVLWEVGAENTEFNDAMYKITFEDAIIKEGKVRGQYIMVVKKGSSRKQWTVYPVFEGKDYDAAKTLFDSKFKEYETKLDKKKVEEKVKQNEYQQLIKKAKDEQKKLEQESSLMMEQMKDKQEKQNELFAIQNNVVRVFTIEKFGVWNCDNPHLQNATALKAILYNEIGQRIDMISVCIVNLRFNGIVSNWIAPKALMTSKYANGKNLIWTITEDKRLLVCNDAGFREGLKKKTAEGFQQFTMRETGVNVKSENDIKAYLFGTLALK